MSKRILSHKKKRGYNSYLIKHQQKKNYAKSFPVNGENTEDKGEKRNGEMEKL